MLRFGMIAMQLQSQKQVASLSFRHRLSLPGEKIVGGVHTLELGYLQSSQVLMGYCRPVVDVYAAPHLNHSMDVWTDQYSAIRASTV